VREVINTDAAVVKHYTFGPFGQTIEESGTLTNPFMFTGQYYDSEIGLYYLRARMYDPQLMRLTTMDPVRGKFIEPMTFHKYLYCENDPVNLVDPNGKYFEGLIGVILGEAISAILRNTDDYASYAVYGHVVAAIGAAWEIYYFWDDIDMISRTTAWQKIAAYYSSNNIKEFYDSFVKGEGD
jgi:RHS repeat-associated protein